MENEFSKETPKLLLMKLSLKWKVGQKITFEGNQTWNIIGNCLGHPTFLLVHPTIYQNTENALMDIFSYK